MQGRALLAEYYFQQNDVDQAQAQLHLIAKPRHNYIALESKYLAAVTQAKIWQLNGKTESAELLLENWNEKLKAINANMYTN